MANEVKWIGPTNRSTGITGNTVNSAAGVLSSEIDNETNKNRFLAVEATLDHASAPTVDREWFLYILYCLDGTNYEDGGTSVQPKKMPAASFAVRADTNVQILAAVDIPLAPFKFKLLLWNGTDQNSATTAVILDAETYDEEVQ